MQYPNCTCIKFQGVSKTFSVSFNEPAPCFGSVLPKPKVTLKGKAASVQLPKGIVASTKCAIQATASPKKGKKSKSGTYRIGKQVAKLSKLASALELCVCSYNN
jgi:hypothetical protein